MFYHAKPLVSVLGVSAFFALELFQEDLHEIRKLAFFFLCIEKTAYNFTSMKSTDHREPQTPNDRRPRIGGTASDLTLPALPIHHDLIIVSGGQSGVDRAALDFALERGIMCAGWCPQGRWAEDCILPPHYPLKESDSPEPARRTELNVIDSDATLILNYGDPQDGTPLTIECTERHNKPCLILNLQEDIDKDAFWDWIDEHRIRALNIAGPRESLSPGQIYALAKATLQNLFKESGANPSY